MTPATIVLVALAGGVGAALRYAADAAVPADPRHPFPWGTWIVNLTGSFALGVIVGAASSWLPTGWATVLGTGLIGGYTTFSTASLETIRLLLDGRRLAAAVNGVGMLVACVALACLGIAATGA